ncbi:MAG: hypothetical protein ACYC6Y_32285 [Thermoguttaceae bacterium]
MNETAESIQRRMEALRCRLDEDVDEVVDTARQYADWRFYVRSYPWACAALALGLGYMVVPRRVEVSSPDVGTLLELAKRNKLVVEAQPAPQVRNRAANQLFGYLMGAAARAAAAYLGQKVGGISGLAAGLADRSHFGSGAARTGR